MADVFYDLTRPDSGMNYRWVQPPQIAYFVTTVDRLGNVNTTPATLGTCVSVDMEPSSCGNYYFTFSLGRSNLPNLPLRHGLVNLEKTPECVISFIGSHLVREAQVTCLPVPAGISEMEAAGLTPLPSRHVRPPGIRECGINLEARVEQKFNIGRYYRHYMCRIVGATIDEDLVKRDRTGSLHAGILEIDPMLELTILGSESSPPRLYFIGLDRDSVRRMPDAFGSSRVWVGSFEDWMEDEEARGKLSAEERRKILALHAEWKSNPDPNANADVKRKLTEWLRSLVSK
jgi:flavin reductase (DIM6/NTAB) family NADH-FMN oxidoreductase RutF